MSDNLDKVILFQIDKTSKMAKLYSQREFDRLGLEITVDQWVLLMIVHENPDMSQKELAGKSLRDPASITRTLDLLQQRGLLVRMAIPENRRQYSIELTRKGKGFVKNNMPVIEKHRRNSIKGLSKADVKTLDQLLRKVQENVK
jgi:DNA-binding MarR family transcriptional regulator